MASQLLANEVLIAITPRWGGVMGRSGSTVARYIKLKGTANIVKRTFKEVVQR